MRIIQKQAWAVDAPWIPNTLDYLETLSYTTDTACDDEVEMILSKEIFNKNPFDDCVNVQKVTFGNQNKFKDVSEEISALPEVLFVKPVISADKESANQVTHEKRFKDVWEEINALAEVLYVESVVFRDEEPAGQDTHGQITLELLTAANEVCGNQKKKKKSVPRRLWGKSRKYLTNRKLNRKPPKRLSSH